LRRAGSVDAGHGAGAAGAGAGSGAAAAAPWRQRGVRGWGGP
jgi:hypothetical protein